MKKLSYLLIFVALMACTKSNEDSSSPATEPEMSDMGIEKHFYGTTSEGDTIASFTLTNSQGMTMEVLDYGGIIVSLTAPDREGNYQDVVLGFENPDPYLNLNPFFGALVGRYGNRIANGSFMLDGTEYILVKNNGENHLHGGLKGFDKVVWESEAISTSEGPKLELHYISADMEEGYPGELDVRITYLLGNDNALRVDYEATTDKSTIVNLTQHSYFNLNPDFETILDHQVTLLADRFLPVDEGLIPLGPPEKVAGTPFDFLQPQAVGARIKEDHPQLKIGGGYDHCWVLNHNPGNQLRTAAVVYEPVSGREMTVETTEPGVQFYTSNFMSGNLSGKGRTFVPHSGLCLETQHFPDSPNRPEYPSTRLDPGDTYHSTTVFKFSVR